MKIHRLLALLLAVLAGLFSCALAEEPDEFARAVELGFLETTPDSPITWKQFCKMAGRMI